MKPTSSRATAVSALGAPMRQLSYRERVCSRSWARQASATISGGRFAWRCLSVPATCGVWRTW
jgi:hypothetical protein